ncbi:YesL family protein [Gracilibacillus sp. YIM 98692]|uniref:YesL family protein n=1 Tax=Gracilibacillus sp. YIM 98692 TaxID=2663532 RepID=UPI0013D58D73|nr:YesL family protein [Gracilibacillus sp. YIM 98692]
MRNSLYGATEWITRFAYVNILWIAFTLLGIVILGFFPATVAMFTLIRKWIMGNTEIPVFPTFWKTFKENFWKSNLIGLVFVVFSYIFYVNVQFMQLNQQTYLDLFKIPIYLFMILVTLTCLYVIPAFVHYDLRLRDIWKNAFFIMVIHPLHNISMIVAVIAVLYVLWLIPGTLIFFGGSLVSFIIMGTCYHAFKRVEEKQARMAEEK